MDTTILQKAIVSFLRQAKAPLARGFKIGIYIFSAVLVGVISAPEFRDWVLANPQFVGFSALINIGLGVLAKVISELIAKNFPDDSKIGEIGKAL